MTAPREQMSRQDCPSSGHGKNYASRVQYSGNTFGILRHMRLRNTGDCLEQAQVLSKMALLRSGETKEVKQGATTIPGIGPSGHSPTRRKCCLQLPMTAYSMYFSSNQTPSAWRFFGQAFRNAICRQDASTCLFLQKSRPR